MKINIFWFRRDFRLNDNKALIRALNADLIIFPVFIVDTNITRVTSCLRAFVAAKKATLSLDCPKQSPTSPVNYLINFAKLFRTII
jgi:deoxyribodipyrimidine photolyase